MLLWKALNLILVMVECTLANPSLQLQVSGKGNSETSHRVRRNGIFLK